LPGCEDQVHGDGGTGGAHRDFSATLDISADLYELARAPVLVVAYGAKSLLDVRATAEMLESLGIPVLGWRTATLPRFYTSKGGPPVSARVNAAGEVAKVASYHWSMPGAGGLLLAQSPPRDLDVDALSEEALRAAEASGVEGQGVTPAVLAYLHEASGGKTARLNQELIAANARLAGAVAAATGPRPETLAGASAEALAAPGASRSARGSRLRGSRRGPSATPLGVPVDEKVAESGCLPARTSCRWS
jgi:pseudouridine-5'-phosphate glycosidase